MEKKSPKHLQRKGELKEALNYYVGRYYEALEEGDRFLSVLYLDEIVQTLILMKGKSPSYETFISEIRQIVLPKLKQDKHKEFDEDLKIELCKRFPEKFREPRRPLEEV